MDAADRQTPPSPWHAGEIAVQTRAGTAERMALHGSRVIRPFMPDQHRDFFAALPFVLVGSVDDDGWPVASLLAGAPGFLASHDPTHLTVGAKPLADEPLGRAMRAGASLGLLGIEPATRRRNRMNGHVERLDETGFVVAVDQSFGNCPQYIHPREKGRRLPGTPAVEPLGAGLDAAAWDLVTRAETCFVASAVPGAGGFAVDISHRGGPAGFVARGSDGALTIPDYPGNGFFNTLGNMLAWPRAGLGFLDFAEGHLLQIEGRVEILWHGTDETERAWRVTPAAARRIRHALPWQFLG